MPFDHPRVRDNVPIAWREPPVRGRQPSGFWKTALARMALACVSDQRGRRRACAVSSQAIHAWVTSLVRQTWPESSERARIAADLAPEVPSWWLGPGEADRLIANALLKRSMRVRQAPAPRRIGAAPVGCPTWVARPADPAGSYAAIAN
jgi:hypothetical protein